MSDSDRLKRIEAALEKQVQEMRDLRVSIEALRNSVESEHQAYSDLRIAAEALLQNVQLHQQNIEVLKNS
jgi:hypothetical protein